MHVVYGILPPWRSNPIMMRLAPNAEPGPTEHRQAQPALSQAHGPTFLQEPCCHPPCSRALLFFSVRATLLPVALADSDITLAALWGLASFSVTRALADCRLSLSEETASKAVVLTSLRLRPFTTLPHVVVKPPKERKKITFSATSSRILLAMNHDL